MGNVISLNDRRPYALSSKEIPPKSADDEFWSTRQELRGLIAQRLAADAAWPESATLAELKRKIMVINAGLSSIRDDIDRLVGERTDE